MKKKVILSVLVGVVCCLLLSCNIFAEQAFEDTVEGTNQSTFSQELVYVVQDTYTIQIPESTIVCLNGDIHTFFLQEYNVASNHRLYVEIENLTDNNDLLLTPESDPTSSNGAHITFYQCDDGGNQQGVVTKENPILCQTTDSSQNLMFCTSTSVDDGTAVGKCNGTVQYKIYTAPVESN